MNNHEPNNAELTPGVLVDCPTCGLPADITDRFTLGGAPGPVEHVKLICVRRHWYTLPVDMLPDRVHHHGEPLDSDRPSHRRDHGNLSSRLEP